MMRHTWWGPAFNPIFNNEMIDLPNFYGRFRNWDRFLSRLKMRLSAEKPLSFLFSVVATHRVLNHHKLIKFGVT